MRVREAEREQALLALLDAVVSSEIDAWVSGVEADRSDDVAWRDALLLLAAALSREWDIALALDRGAPPGAPDDRVARWLRQGAAAWASSGDPSQESSQSLSLLLEDAPEQSEGPLARFAAYLYVEAAMAHARLDLAQQIAERWGDALWEPLLLGGREHPFEPVLGVCRTRLLAFGGEVSAAEAVYRALPESPHATVTALCVATGCLVRGNAADPVEARRLAQVVQDLVDRPIDHLTAGAHLLVAFGLIAVGEVSGAVRSVLAAGLDADLAGCNVIDRTLGLELLVALAVAEGDLDSAEAWRDRAAPLLASPIADSTVARIHSRVLILSGHLPEAIAWAERAVELAEARSRVIEACEARILLSRARLAGPGPVDRREATRGLQEMVAQAEARGHSSARRAAARELRPLGRRLPPLAGSGWAGLSEREAEVATWVARGATNREVAAAMFVSEHTVRAHVSRVLTAFAIGTRSGLPAALDAFGSSAYADLAASHPPLTARQHQVAVLVADGLGNRAIGERLDLSVRTVERHVGDILQRWGLPSRTALAHAVCRLPASQGRVPADPVLADPGSRDQASK